MSVFLSCSRDPRLKTQGCLARPDFILYQQASPSKERGRKAKKQAKDDFRLQPNESIINLVTRKGAHLDSNSFYTERLANPSLSSTKPLAARCVTRLSRGEFSEAKSDLGRLSVKEVRMTKLSQRMPLP